jgi:hypothetical protein
MLFKNRYLPPFLRDNPALRPDTKALGNAMFKHLSEQLALKTGMSKNEARVATIAAWEAGYLAFVPGEGGDFRLEPVNPRTTHG